MDEQNEQAEGLFAGADNILDGEARVNITWNGSNGDLQQPVAYDATDGDIKQWVTEAVQHGVPGIPADAAVDLTDFVVDRFAANETRPFNLIQIRPKTPFGMPIECPACSYLGETCPKHRAPRVR